MPARSEVLDALSNQVGIVLDAAGRIVALTPAAHVALGGRLEVGSDFVDLVVPDDRPAALTLLTADPLDNDAITLRCAHLDGSYRTFACRSRTAAGGELVICADDVTARDRARAEIALHDALLASLRHESDLAATFEASARLAEAGAPGTRAAVYRIVDDHMELLAAPGLPLLWNRVATRLPIPDGAASDVDIEPAAGRTAELASEHGLGFGWVVMAASAGAHDGASPSAPSIAVCTFVGAKRFLTASERASVSRAAMLAADAIALHDRLAAADVSSSTDPLTGVLARPALFDALEAAPRPLTLMLVHVGGIADVNAAHGFEAGDATLRAVALALQGIVRRRDIVGRLSGATFAIAGSSRSADRDAGRWADRVREAVRTRLVAAGRVLEPACRVAHVLGPPDVSAAELVRQAEAQLRGNVTGITARGDAASGRRQRDR